MCSRPRSSRASCCRVVRRSRPTTWTPTRRATRPLSSRARSYGAAPTSLSSCYLRAGHRPSGCAVRRTVIHRSTTRTRSRSDAAGSGYGRRAISPACGGLRSAWPVRRASTRCGRSSLPLQWTPAHHLAMTPHAGEGGRGLGLPPQRRLGLPHRGLHAHSPQPSACSPQPSA